MEIRDKGGLEEKRSTLLGILLIISLSRSASRDYKGVQTFFSQIMFPIF